MRTIKCRAKSCYTGKWLYGDLVTYKSGEAAIANFTNFGYECGEMMCRESIDPATIGQFTGLTDKRGHSIHEGDIIRHEESTWMGVVTWHPNGYFFINPYGVDFPRDNRYRPLGDMLEVRQFVVIGNIHDNQQLLKGGKQ